MAPARMVRFCNRHPISTIKGSGDDTIGFKHGKTIEKPTNKWRFRSLGTSSISMCHGFHGYVSHNQRVKEKLSITQKLV